MSNIITYYPPISEIINRTFIPGDITFLDEGVFKAIRYKNFKVNGSPYGDIRTYDLTIVLKETRTTLLGTDLELVFFPNETEDLFLHFYLRVHWGIKRYIREFELGSFSFSLQEYFELLLKMIRVSKEEFINGIIVIFIDNIYPHAELVKSISETIRRYKAGDIIIKDELEEIKNNADDIIAKLDQLASDLEYPSNLVDPFEDPLAYLLESINQIGYNLDIYQLIYESLTGDSQSFDQKLNRLIWLFRYWMGNVTKEDLANLLIPQFSLSISDLKLALAFPKSWLQPMDLSLDKALLNCTVKNLKYSTQTGLQFNEFTEFHLSRCSIMNTGIIIEATGGKLDLNENESIQEAIDDEREVFQGIYLEVITVELLPEMGIVAGELKGHNFLIGSGAPDKDGISGMVKIENAPLIVDLSVIQLQFSKLDIVFKHNVVDSSDIAGLLRIPGLDKSSGGTDIAFAAEFDEKGFKNTTASLPSEKNFTLFGINIKLEDLTIGFNQSGLNQLDIGAMLTLPLQETNGDSIEVKVNVNYRKIDQLYEISLFSENNLNFLGLPIKISTLSGSFDNTGLITLDVTGSIIISGISDKDADGNEVPLTLLFEIKYDKDQNNYQFSGSTAGPFSLFGTEAEVSDLKLSAQGTNQIPLSTLAIAGKLLIPGIKNTDGSDVQLDLELLISGTKKSFSVSKVPSLKLGDYAIYNFNFHGTLDDGGDHEVVLGGNLDLTALGIDDPVSFLIIIKPGSLVVTIADVPEAKITFPSNKLVQVDKEFKELTDEPANITFSLGEDGLTVDSNSGLQIKNVTATFNQRDTEPKPRAFAAKIPKAGLFVDFVEATADFSATPEFSVSTASIWLPSLKKKSNEDESPSAEADHLKLTGENLVINKDDGISGKISLTTPTEIDIIADNKLKVSYVSIELEKNKITRGELQAQLLLPNNPEKIGLSFTVVDQIPQRDYYLYKATMQGSTDVKLLGRDITINAVAFSFSEHGIEEFTLSGTITLQGKKLTVDITATQDGFAIVGEPIPPLEIPISTLLTLNLSKLGFGEWGGQWFFLLDASGAFLFNLPIFGDILPEEFNFHPLLLGERPVTDELQAFFFDPDKKLPLPANFQPPENTALSLKWPDGYTISNQQTSRVIAINKKLLGFLEFNTLKVSVELEEADKLGIDLGFNIGLDLGPVYGAVDGLGISLELSLPENKDGNVGPLQIDTQVKPPDAIMLTIEAAAISGSGAIYRDDSVYKGFIELSFANKFTLNALAIVRTKMPDGTPKLSFLVLINATDLLIQIGMGFVITGLGGIFGFRRHANTNYIRDLAFQGSLDEIMFPSLEIDNLDTVLSKIASAFPPMDRHFVAGIFARLEYGGINPILRIYTGLIINFDFDGQPVIILPGTLRTLLPQEDLDLVVIEARFIAIVDLPRKKLTFEASIEGSRLMKFTLSGRMILVLTWGEDPSFLVSAGGFHPSFDPPAGLPTVPERIQLTLVNEEKNKVFLAMYLAVTSNTAQTGARVEARFRAMGFDILGWVGFDVLFQFNPFAFEFSVSAGFGVFKKGDEKGAMMVSFKLRGPRFWDVRGTGRVTLLGIDIILKFSKQWGDLDFEFPPLVTVFPLLIKALNNDDNWRVELANDRFDLISYRQLGDQEVAGLVIHPAAVPSFHQTVVPLKQKISQFGSGKPIDGDSFKIRNIKVLANGVSVDPGAKKIMDLFAPAQFFELSDTEKLQSPSFKKYHSGYKLTGLNSLKMGAPVKKDLMYESIVIRKDKNDYLNMIIQDPAAWQQSLSPGGAAGQSELSGNNRPGRLQDKVVELQEEEFLIVNNTNFEVPEGIAPDQLTNMEEALRNMLEENPELEGKLEIIPAYELGLEIPEISSPA